MGRCQDRSVSKLCRQLAVARLDVVWLEVGSLEVV